MDTLITGLRALPNPALPRDLTADVLARVEANERRRQAPVSAALSPSMLAVLGAVLAMAAIAASVTSGDLSLFHVAPLSVGGLDMPNGVGGLSLLVGLALYALGLFGTVGQRRMPYSSTST